MEEENPGNSEGCINCGSSSTQQDNLDKKRYTQEIIPPF